MSQNQLSTKDPKENVVLTFDFTLALVGDETLTSIDEVEVIVSSGSDDAAQDVLAAPAIVTLDGLKVQQPVRHGKNGVNYNIKVLCQTSNPQKKIALMAILPVRTK